MKKIYSIILLIVLFVGCNKTEEEDIYFGGTCPESHYEITGIEGFNLKPIDSLFNSNYIVEENATINWNELLIRYEIDKQDIAAKQLESTLSCAPAERIGLDTIYLKLLFDYSTEYLAQDTINDIVSVHYLTASINQFENFFSVAEYVEQNKYGVFTNSFDIKLNQAPVADTIPFAIEMEYILNDGQVFRDTTEVINLAR